MKDDRLHALSVPDSSAEQALSGSFWLDHLALERIQHAVAPAPLRLVLVGWPCDRAH